MQEKPRILTIGNMEIPLWCDLFVLNEIQEEYGLIGEFEKKLMGLKEEKGVWKKTEPDVGAILFVLPLMAREGYQKEAYMGIERERVDVEKILMEVNLPFTELAEIVHEEFKRCFASKKADQTRDQKKKSR